MEQIISLLMSRQAANILGRLGIRPSPVINENMQLPAEVRTRQELDAFGQAAIELMHSSGGRDAAMYLQWQHMLAAGLDETLPDVEAMQGGILKSSQQMQQELADHADSSKHYITQAHPMVAAAGWQGHPYEDIKEALMIRMAESTSQRERDYLLQLDNALEDSGRSAMTSISWELPEQPVGSLTYEVGTDDTQMARPLEGGLDDMAIKPSVADDAIWSGIVDWNGSGGRYEVWSDTHLHQQIAQQEQDFHQGDAGANTQAPL